MADLNFTLAPPGAIEALDRVLLPWHDALGKDLAGYRHHCCRVLCLAHALSPDVAENLALWLVAIAHHDLGIWTDHTFDYLLPLRRLACEHLREIAHPEWVDEIESMIEQHHRVRPWPGAAGARTEVMRRADWIDVSLGWLTLGLPRDRVHEIRRAFPNAGFHKRLLALTWQRWRRHPLSSLPMMKW